MSDEKNKRVRELDVNVLLKVMGGSIAGSPRGNQELRCAKGYRIGSRRGCKSEWHLLGYQKTDLPYYSTDIADAWLVVEKMKEPDNETMFLIDLRWSVAGGQWRAEFENYEKGIVFYAYADTAPEAICRAALVAIEGGKYGGAQ